MLHTRDQRGFTLIELMIVVAIIAIIASIAIPNLLSARLNANETAAIATLKTIVGAQGQCRNSGVIDVDRNGAGEYGFGAELGALRGIRTAAGTASPTEFISPPLFRIDGGAQIVYMGGIAPPGGAMARSGYFFGMFLPGPGGAFVPDSPNGGGDPAHIPNPSFAEALWCCYAWPQTLGASGKRVFFVNQAGDILAARNDTAATRYSGGLRGPRPDAAFVASGLPSMSSTVAANTIGADGQRWTVVN